jgi:cytochrome P450
MIWDGACLTHAPSSTREPRAEKRKLRPRRSPSTRRDPELAQREDILSLLMSAHGGRFSGMSDGELRDQLVTLLLAGHETAMTLARVSLGHAIASSSNQFLCFVSNY